MQYLRNLLNKLRFSAFPRLITDGLKHVGIVIVPYHLYRRSVADTYRAPPDDSHADFVELFDDDMAAIAGLPMVPGSEAFFRGLLAEGQRCFGLRLDDQLVGFCWMDPRECHVHGAHFELGEAEAYAHDIFTVPGYRGRAVAPLLNAYFSALLVELGVETVYSVIDVFNRPSRNFAAKIGCQPVRLVLYFSVFGVLERSVTLKRLSGDEFDA